MLQMMVAVVELERNLLAKSAKAGVERAAGGGQSDGF